MESGRTGPALHLAQLREALAQHLPRRGRGSVRVQLGGLGRQNTGESQESQQHNLQHAVHRGKHPGCRWWALAYAAPPLVVVAVGMYTPPSTGLSHAHNRQGGEAAAAELVIPTLPELAHGMHV